MTRVPRRAHDERRPRPPGTPNIVPSAARSIRQLGTYVPRRQFLTRSLSPPSASVPFKADDLRVLSSELLVSVVRQAWRHHDLVESESEHASRYRPVDLPVRRGLALCSPAHPQLDLVERPARRGERCIQIRDELLDLRDRQVVPRPAVTVLDDAPDRRIRVSPTTIGGCGRWTGFGKASSRAKLTNSPSNDVISSSLHSAFIARRYSSVRAPRRRTARRALRTPRRTSRRRHRSRTAPRRSRRRSAMSRARMIGLRCASTHTYVPSRTVLVTIASTARPTNGS